MTSSKERKIKWQINWIRVLRDKMKKEGEIIRARNEREKRERTKGKWKKEMERVKEKVRKEGINKERPLIMSNKLALVEMWLVLILCFKSWR